MKINRDKKQIRTFGFGAAVILTTLALWNFYKGSPTSPVIFLVIGIILGILALFFPSAIKPVYIVFMKVAHILGWINTRILLAFIFYVILTPIGLIMRIFGKDFLDESIDPARKSYWVTKERKGFNKNDYEREF